MTTTGLECSGSPMTLRTDPSGLLAAQPLDVLNDLAVVQVGPDGAEAVYLGVVGLIQRGQRTAQVDVDPAVIGKLLARAARVDLGTVGQARGPETFGVGAEEAGIVHRGNPRGIDDRQLPRVALADVAQLVALQIAVPVGPEWAEQREVDLAVVAGAVEGVDRDGRRVEGGAVGRHLGQDVLEHAHQVGRRLRLIEATAAGFGQVFVEAGRRCCCCPG